MTGIPHGTVYVLVAVRDGEPPFVSVHVNKSMALASADNFLRDYDMSKPERDGARYILGEFGAHDSHVARLTLRHQLIEA